MSQIWYTAQGYNGSFSGINRSSKTSVSCNILDLCRTSITAGNPKDFIWNDIKDYGLYRAFASLVLENLLRVSAALCTNDKGDVCLHPIYNSYVSDRKRSISYNLGMAIAKLFSERLLGIPDLIHVETLKRIKAIKFKKPGRSKEPDLVGCAKDGSWHIFESKGSIKFFSDNAWANARKQVGAIATIHGQVPATRSVCVSRLGFDNIFTDIRDPEGSEEKEIVEVNKEKYYEYYYFPFTALREYTNSELHKTQLYGSTYDSFDIQINNNNFTIGLDSEIFALLQGKRYEQIAECFRNRRSAVDNDGEHVSTGLDGFMIRDNRRQT
ncbi:hypothetical protein FACS189461_3770 [Spirochaetia bacterium]|nr:hypothetical protein FACS189461_3770 [Spirochaetia bacterium]